MDPIVVRNVRKRLAEYTIDRDSNEAVTAVISFENADEELKCGICLGTIDKTWTVIACIHRFCSDCLHRSLRMDLGSQKTIHECPLCRVKIPSRRSSKPDPTFDALIGILTDANDGTGAATMLPTATSAYDATTNGGDDDGANGGRSVRAGGAGEDNLASFSSSSYSLDISAFRRVHEENVRRFRQRSESLRSSSFTQHNGHSGSPRPAMHSPYAGASNGSHSSSGSPNARQLRHEEQEQGRRHLERGDQHCGPSSSSAGTSSRHPGKCGESDYVQWSLEPLEAADGSSANTQGRGAGAVLSGGDCGEFRLEKAYLRSSAALTMADVKAYLSQKFCVAAQVLRESQGDAWQEEEEIAATAVVQARAIELFTRRRQQMNLMMAVTDDLTLRDICLQYWDAQSELNLFFRLGPTQS